MDTTKNLPKLNLVYLLRSDAPIAEGVRYQFTAVPGYELIADSIYTEIYNSDMNYCYMKDWSFDYRCYATGYVEFTEITNTRGGIKGDIYFEIPSPSELIQAENSIVIEGDFKCGFRDNFTPTN